MCRGVCLYDVLYLILSTVQLMVPSIQPRDTNCVRNAQLWEDVGREMQRSPLATIYLQNVHIICAVISNISSIT